MRDDETVQEGVDAVGERPGAGHEPVDPGQDRLVIGQRLQLGRDPVKAARLVGEAQPLAADHAQPGPGGGQLGDEEGAAPRFERVGRNRQGGDARLQRFRGRGELLDRARSATSRLAPWRRAIIGVDIAFVALADLELHPDIVARHRIEAVGLGHGGRAAGEEQERQDQGEEFHVCGSPAGIDTSVSGSRLGLASEER